MTNNAKTCSVTDCNRPVQSKAMCSMHYQRARAGQPLVQPRDGVQVCSVPDCETTNEERHLSRGMCVKHYSRWLKYGTTDAAAMGRDANGSQQNCEAPDCDRPALAKRLCTLHYQRARRGLPLDHPTRYERGLPLAQRVMRYVTENEAGCWEWQGAKDGDGYGSIRIGDQSLGAHRVAYEALVGPIPEGLHLDHRCRNVACVNPQHLDPVTNAENVRRGYLTAEEHWAL